MTGTQTIMKLSVLVDPAFENLAETERAVNAINQLQNCYSISMTKVRWINKGRKDKIIDTDLVFKEKKRNYGSGPAIIITQNPLKLGYSADFRDNMYIVSIARGYNRYQAPPLRISIMYYLICVLGTFECQMTETDIDNGPVHEGRPTGCISDLCEHEGDLLISMKMAHICRRCKRDYIEHGLSKKGMSAIQRVLRFVKEESQKYDRKIPYDAFISYSHKDKHFVDKVADLLEAKRLKVWYDDFSILPGDSILKKLERGIKNSRCFIVVLSPDFIKSRWCEHELEIAINQALSSMSRRKVKVLPLLHKECKIPGYLSPYKYADLREGNFQKGMDDIWAALRIHNRRRKTKSKAT